MDTKGERLKAARIGAGFTSARSAAIHHGWTVSTYGAHENGQNEFDEEAAQEYAKAFKTRADWLLLGVRDDAASPGIDIQLRQLPADVSKALIERFNSIIEGVRLSRKL